MRTGAVIGVWGVDAGFAAMVVDVVRAAGFAVVLSTDLTAAVDAWIVVPEAGADATWRTALTTHERVLVVGECVLPGAMCLPRPDPAEARSLLQWSARLIGACRHLVEEVPVVAGVGAPVATTAAPAAATPPLIAIAVSTGGPPALEVVLRDLASPTMPPILIVQHIPPSFVAPLCERLTGKCGLPVAQVGHGERLVRGQARMAPGDRHVVASFDGDTVVVHHDGSPPRRGHRPAAAVTFASLAALPVPGVAVMMTGMGVDGAEELVQLRSRGWRTFGQDEASCAVYGMPGAARRLGAVERELPLARLGAAIRQACLAQVVARP